MIIQKIIQKIVSEPLHKYRLLLGFFALMTALPSARSTAPDWTPALAIERALLKASEHFEKVRGPSANESFLGFQLEVSGYEIFANAAEWAWRSGDEVYIWNFLCYRSAEEGPQCYQNATSGSSYVAETYRRVTENYVLSRQMEKAIAALKGTRGSIKKLSVHADPRGFVLLVTSPDRSTPSFGWLCPFAADRTCQSVPVQSLPTYPSY